MHFFAPLLALFETIFAHVLGFLQIVCLHFIQKAHLQLFVPPLALFPQKLPQTNVHFCAKKQ